MEVWRLRLGQEEWLGQAVVDLSASHTGRQEVAQPRRASDHVHFQHLKFSVFLVFEFQSEFRACQALFYALLGDASSCLGHINGK